MDKAFFTALLAVLSLIPPGQALTAPSIERSDISIQPGTTIPLSSINPPIDLGGTMPVLYVNHLVLGERAEILFDTPIQINAKKVTLKPGSRIHTDGNPIIIKANIFIPGDISIDFQGLSTEERKQKMGVIDTTYTDHNGTPGRPGAKGGNGWRYPHPFERPWNQGTPRDPDLGQPGGPGEPAGSGKDAGRVTLIVKHFYGAYILANGGNGGPGGPGGRGGQGGHGLLINKALYGTYDNLVASGASFLTGARGGDAGNGGRGGNGGDGGTVIIKYQVKMKQSDDRVLVYNDGGQRGEGGHGRNVGPGGEEGKVPASGSGDSGTIFHIGPPGANGQVGQDGPNGSDGQDGSNPVFEKNPYEEK